MLDAVLNRLWSRPQRVAQCIAAVLGRHPELTIDVASPPRTVANGDVVKWHRWGCLQPLGAGRWGPGELRGWHYRRGRYESVRGVRQDLADFGCCDVIDHWTCDIRDVEGLGASKSNMASFESLDALAEVKAAGLITPPTQQQLEKNLAWGEVRILHQATHDHFARYRWDGRIFLVNDGGSHHFAAARYLAARLGQPVPLVAKLCTYAINEHAVTTLTRDYAIFALGTAAAGRLAFHDCMEKLRAAYLWCALPAPYHPAARAVLLPRSDAHSDRVSRVLRAAGCCDLGEHLRALCATQTSGQYAPSPSAGPAVTRATGQAPHCLAGGRATAHHLACNRTS